MLAPILLLCRGGVDSVADVMDDATEAMEDQQEVQEALSAGFGNPFVGCKSSADRAAVR